MKRVELPWLSLLNFGSSFTVLTLSLARWWLNSLDSPDTVSGKMMAELLDSPDTVSGKLMAELLDSPDTVSGRMMAELLGWHCLWQDDGWTSGQSWHCWTSDSPDTVSGKMMAVSPARDFLKKNGFLEQLKHFNEKSRVTMAFGQLAPLSQSWHCLWQDDGWTSWKSWHCLWQVDGWTSWQSWHCLWQVDGWLSHFLTVLTLSLARWWLNCLLTVLTLSLARWWLNFLTVLTLSLARWWWLNFLKLSPDTDTVSGRMMAELLESTDTASGPWLSHLQEKKKWVLTTKALNEKSRVTMAFIGSSFTVLTLSLARWWLNDSPDTASDDGFLKVLTLSLARWWLNFLTVLTLSLWPLTVSPARWEKKNGFLEQLKHFNEKSRVTMAWKDWLLFHSPDTVSGKMMAELLDSPDTVSGKLMAELLGQSWHCLWQDDGWTSWQSWHCLWQVDGWTSWQSWHCLWKDDGWTSWKYWHCLWPLTVSPAREKKWVLTTKALNEKSRVTMAFIGSSFTVLTLSLAWWLTSGQSWWTSWKSWHCLWQDDGWTSGQSWHCLWQDDGWTSWQSWHCLWQDDGWTSDMAELLTVLTLPLALDCLWPLTVSPAREKKWVLTTKALNEKSRVTMAFIGSSFTVLTLSLADDGWWLNCLWLTVLTLSLASWWLNFLTVLTLSLARWLMAELLDSPDTVSGKMMAELLDSPDTASGPWLSLSHLQERKKMGFNN